MLHNPGQHNYMYIFFWHYVNKYSNKCTAQWSLKLNCLIVDYLSFLLHAELAFWFNLPTQTFGNK